MSSAILLWSVLESDTRATITDVALILGFIVALAAALKILWSWTTRPRRILRWMWRRTWGRDDHGVWLTPSVRFDRRIQGAVEEKMDQQTVTLVAEVARSRQDAAIDMGALRRENSSQHAAVEARLAALEESHHALSERLVAVETALRIADRE